MNQIQKLRDAQRAGRNPGHELGTFLSHSNSPEYLVSQLAAYLAAVQADLAAERAFAGGLLRALKADAVAEAEKEGESSRKKKPCRLLPCATCPWRVGNDAGCIPGYDPEKAESLLNTVGEGDALRPIMACHGSTPRQQIACKGYLAREGWSNLNVRLLLSSGRIENPDDVLDACSAGGVALEPSYPAVLLKLKGGA